LQSPNPECDHKSTRPAETTPGAFFLWVETGGTPGPKPQQPANGRRFATGRDRDAPRTRGFNEDVFRLKCRADEGDRTAALELAERELNRARPNLIQAYRWLYVAGEMARAEKTLVTLSPEQRTEAERVTTAYVQRPTAPKSR
jgi:hypothetical protein